MDFGIANVAVVTALVWIIGTVVHTSPLNNKWIPSICGVCGIILGIVAFYIGVPDFPARDVLTAAAVGGVSGAAATWIDQMYNQLYVKPKAQKVEEQAEDSSETDN